MSNIEWTQETWNPVVGCTPVSAGCRNCYAARDALRMAGNPHPQIGPVYEGLATKPGGGGRPVFTGKVRLLEERLAQPLGWKKPRRVFVNSMSDLFHPAVPDEFILRVWATMFRASQHTYQILTKRPERMASWVAGFYKTVTRWAWKTAPEPPEWPLEFGEGDFARELVIQRLAHHVWLGTSIEDQATADERIPYLLQTPAAVRFVSYEPALGPVDLSRYLLAPHLEGHMACAGIHWVIAGGESGPRARACNVQWIRDVVRQCKDAGVPCFVKQIGARPVVVRPTPCEAWPDSETEYSLNVRSPKGSDPEEWPEDLRVREFPERTDP